MKHSRKKVGKMEIYQITKARGSWAKECLKKHGSLVQKMDESDGEIRLQHPVISDPFESGFWSYWVKSKDVDLKKVGMIFQQEGGK